MLEVQKYLMHSTLGELEEDFGIKINYHPLYPMAILNYDQIESPKMHPIVRECRGLVLDINTFEIVAGCMPRFFNMGEALEITKEFIWDDDMTMRTKEDGSIITYFWNPYANVWAVKTRGSWADMPIGENLPRWDELVLSLIPTDVNFQNSFSTDCSYVFELCTMWNQVVRLYPEPKLFLLTIIINNSNIEFCDDETTHSAKGKGLERPALINLKNESAVRDYIKLLEETDGTAEGLVLRDRNDLRVKVKSSTYLAYSRLGNNGNIATDSNLVPLIMANEQDEAIAIFPAIEKRVNELKEIINEHLYCLTESWHLAKGIEDQKTFALKIMKECPTPFASILFTLKKKGLIHDFNELVAEWRNNENLILKVIKG